MSQRRKSDAALARHKWSSFPSVQIIEVLTKKDSFDGRAEVYTAYKLQVKDGNNTWTLYKRYSNFLDLHSKLKDNFVEDQLPQLPERRWNIFELNLLWKENNLSESRREALEQYLKTLLADAQFIQCSEVRAFLEPDDLSLALRKKKGVTEDPDMFLLPPPPASARRIPQIVIISNSPTTSPATSPNPLSSSSSIEIRIPSSISLPRGILMSELKPIKKRESQAASSPPQPELCHISYLLSSIKDGLEYLSELKTGLKGNVTSRLEYLEQRRSRVDSTIATLQREKQVLTQLLKNTEISTNSDLKEYFTLCMEKISKGLEWYPKVEDELMEQVYVEIIEKQKKGIVDLHPKISKLEEEAENLIIEFLERSDPEVMSRISALETKIEVLLQEIDPSTDQVFITRLKNILNYLKPNFEPFDFEEPKEKTIDDLD